MATHENIEQRRQRMKSLLLQKGVASLSQLSDGLRISESTVRRDLEALEEQGLIKRTHGGAVCMRYTPQQNLGFIDRQTAMVDQKNAIAQAVAAVIADNQTVVLDAGTTTCSVAQALRGRHISVVTNSVPIASLLLSDSATEVTLVGGYLYPRTGAALGEMARLQLAGLHASVAVMSCSGLGPAGVFNTNQMIVDIERQMMAAAEKVILAVDHSKFELHGLTRLCSVEEIDVIVTDSGVSPSTRQWLESLAVEVIVA